MQRWLGDHQRAELVRPAGRQAIHLAGAVLPGEGRHDGIGKRLGRRALGQARRQRAGSAPSAVRGGAPSKLRLWESLMSSSQPRNDLACSANLAYHAV